MLRIWPLDPAAIARKLLSMKRKTEIPVNFSLSWLLLSCLLLSWAFAPAALAQEAPSVYDTAAEAIAEQAGGPKQVRGLHFSQAVEGQGGKAVCARTDAYNATGHFVGQTFLLVTLSADGKKSEVRNMTGLLSDCYGVQYAPYKFDQ